MKNVFFSIALFAFLLTSRAWGVSYTAIVLTPSGFNYSIAYGISGTQQVGYGRCSSGIHALLWNGTAASYVDLNPSGFNESMAFDTSGTHQVGYGVPATGGNDHVLLWNGSADSFVDLHQFLPTGFVYSVARGIDSYGNIVGYATDSLGNGHAILWQVPEPATLLLFALACPLGGGLALRRKR